MSANTELRCSDVGEWLEELAPARLAEDYDNVGLLVGEASTAVSGILIALDITPEVLAEAKASGANLVVTHHPIWFRSRKSLRGDDFVSRQILYAVRNNITLYACHTNLDSVRQGVNSAIVNRLKLQNIRFLAPSKDGQTGAGMVGDLPEPVASREFLALTQRLFDCGCIRYSEGRAGADIQRVAVCGGSGSFLLEAALASKADAFLTGDVTYHQFFDSQGEMLFMDIGHYESEQYTSEVLRDYLHAKLKETNSSIQARITSSPTNPVRYFTAPR